MHKVGTGFGVLLFAHLTIIHCQTEKCGYNVTSSSGIINSPGPKSTEEFCKWTILPPNTVSKLFVKVLSATLPRNFDLIVYSDGNENLINKDCENCIDPFVTSTLKIFLQRTVNIGNSTFNFAPKFDISYEAFLPDQCAPPVPLRNGQIIGDNFKLGNTVLFHCHNLYHMIGNSMATCIITKSSPIPKWNAQIPRCFVPKCLGVPIKLSATTTWNAICNPGYENDQIEAGQDCVWNITTIRKDQRLRARFHFINLYAEDYNAETPKLVIYDDSFDNPIFMVNSSNRNVSEIVTKSNTMIVIFRTGANVPLGASGFIMNYSSVSIQCPNPESPTNGKIFPKKKSYGLHDFINLECDDGFSLVNGSAKLSCTISGEWSDVFGVCAANKMASPAVKVKTFTQMYDGENVTVLYNDTHIRDYDPFSIKNKSNNESLDKSKDIPKYFPKPTKFKKKAHYYTKTIRKPSKKPNTLHNFTNGLPKTKLSKYPEKQTKLILNEQELTKRKKTTSGPFIARTVAPFAASSSTENVKAVESSNQPSMNAFIDAELVLIVSGISVPILLIIIIVLIFIIYRRYYPVRMLPGRKFSTFENPMYERRSPRRDLSPESQHLNSAS